MPTKYSENNWSDEEERRMNERRANCIDHENQHKNIERIAKAVSDQSHSVNRQDGQWKILMWGMSLLFTSIIGIGFLMNTSIKETKNIVVSMDKTVTVYMQTHRAETSGDSTQIKANDKDIDLIINNVDNHENRLKILETFHNRN